MAPLFQTTVPLFVKVQFGRSWLFAVVIFRVLPAGSVKIPSTIPAVQPIAPCNTALVLPTSAPLSTVNEPLAFTVKGPFNESVWPASERVTGPAPLVPRMIPPTVVVPLSETVTPALVMTAVSVAPGTVLGFQLAAEFQTPLALLVQLIVAACTARLARTPQPTTAVLKYVLNKWMVFMVFTFILIRFWFSRVL